MSDSKSTLRNNSTGLDERKISSFLSKTDPKFHPILNVLFKNTIYYTTNEIVRMTNSQIEKWKSERDNTFSLYVFLPMIKIGSEHWLYYNFKDVLPKHTLIHEYNSQMSEITSPSEVLSIDDMALSGNNACSSFEELFYNYRGKTFQQTHEEEKKTIVRKLSQLPIIQFTAIFAITTDNAFMQLSDLTDYYYNINLKIYAATSIERLDQIIKGTNIDPNSDTVKQFFIQYSPDTEDAAYPIHLEYKIANQFGSYPEIYTKTRNVPISRDFMKTVEQYFKNIKKSTIVI